MNILLNRALWFDGRKDFKALILIASQVEKDSARSFRKALRADFIAYKLLQFQITTGS